MHGFLWDKQHVHGEYIPTPPHEKHVGYLFKGKVFTKLDLREEYYQVRLKKGNKWKTTFNSPIYATNLM